MQSPSSIGTSFGAKLLSSLKAIVAPIMPAKPALYVPPLHPEAFEFWLPILARWEGGWSDHVDDLGGKTMKGITLAVWNVYAPKFGWQSGEAGLRNLTENQWRIIAGEYWNAAVGTTPADGIASPAVAVYLADYRWGGIYVVGLQAALNQRGANLVVDGGLGQQTRRAMNAQGREMLPLLHKLRAEWLEIIMANNPKQESFRKGWYNRINDLYAKLQQAYPQG